MDDEEVEHLLNENSGSPVDPRDKERATNEELSLRRSSKDRAGAARWCMKSKINGFVVPLAVMTMVCLFCFDLGRREAWREVSLGEEGGRRERTNVMVSFMKQIPGIKRDDKKGNDVDKFYGLDIYVIGFAKTGTGSLRELFVESDEVAMLGRENRDLFYGTPEQALTQLEEDFKTVPNANVAMRAVKAPKGILNMKSINRLVQYTSTDTKLVLGLRHPVRWFQSYYNYRLRKDMKFHELYGTVETFYERHVESRFDLYMKQLAKVDLSSDELKEMANITHLTVAPNPYKIFVFHCEQMADDDEERSARFRREFQMYLGLKRAIDEWPQDKMFPVHYPEEIDICEPKFDGLRQRLLSDGRIAAAWIRDKFVEGADVVVGGREYFMDLLDLWGEDVCP